MNNKTVSQRFWEKVVKTDSCWNWSAYCLKKSGHGQFSENKKFIYAHRFSWQLHFGNIPKGMSVLHKCDNGSCVNPKHLFLGNQKDNMVDMAIKGRKTGSKLTNEQVVEIRNSYSFRKTTYKVLADKFGVTWSTIRRVLKRDTYDYI